MKYLLTIVAILVLIAGLAIGFVGHAGVMAIAFFGFIGLLVAANLDRISEFKASRSGIEAKTREVIARAETTLSELQLLGRNVAEVTLSLVKRSGRLGGYTDDEQESIKESVLTVLKKVGVPEKELLDVLKDWHTFVEFDYAHAILGGHTVPEGVDPAVAQEWKAIRSGGIVRVPTPEEIRTFLTKHRLSIDCLDDYLKDYEYYRLHRKHRRPEIWKDRSNWGRLKKT